MTKSTLQILKPNDLASINGGFSIYTATGIGLMAVGKLLTNL